MFSNFSKLSVLFALFLIMTVPTSMLAYDSVANDTCPGEVITEINGTTSNAYVQIDGSLTKTPADTDFYSFQIDANGTLEMNLSLLAGGANIDYTVYRGANCGSMSAVSTIPNTGSFVGAYLSVTAGDILYIKLDNPNKDTDYALQLGFTVGGGGGGMPYNPNGMDAIEPTYDYAVDRNITTKIMYKPFDLKLVYLDANGSVHNYESLGGYELPVMLRLCTAQNIKLYMNPTSTNPLPTFTSGDSEIIAYDLIVPQVHKDDRVKMEYLDWGQIMDWPSATMNCVQKSTTTGNYKGVPQCLNSEAKLGDLFPASEYPYVHGVCLGEDLNLTGNEVAACTSNAYSSWNLNNAKTIVPSIYRHIYGCYECLLKGVFDVDICSTDNFASRPDYYDLNLSAGTIITAGDPTSLHFTATEYNSTTPAFDYNETEGMSFEVNVTIGDTTKICPQPYINMIPDVDFINGEVTDNYAFDNIGDVNLTVSEINGSEYAAVDSDDTPDDDRFITPFLVQFRLIPDRFDVNASLIDFGSNFTYLHDINASGDYNISAATLSIDINATSADGNVTSNYVDTCYAKDTNITLQTSGTRVVPASALKYFLYYNPVTNDLNATDLNTLPNYTATGVIPYLPISNISTSFPLNAPDGNGTTHIEYKLNFDRKVNRPVDPFRVSLTNADINDTDGVTGSDTTADTATFLYGRAHAPRYRVDCNDTTGNCATSQPLLIYFEFYSSDSNLTLRRNAASGLGIGDQLRSKDAVRWFRNVNHAATDGNATSVTQRYTASSPITPSAITHSGNTDEQDYAYSGGSGYPYKASMELNASRWLIYNRFEANATSNGFQLEFNAGPGTKAGTDNLESGTDTGAGANTNRRIRW